MTLGHTNDSACPRCPGPHGRPSHCDHQSYSRRRVRFIRAHKEAFDAAYLNPDPKTASNELERLNREYRTLPPRHSCSCPKMNPRNGVIEYHCVLCRKIGEQIPHQDVALEIGRTSPVHAPMPMVICLDIEAGYAA